LAGVSARAPIAMTSEERMTANLPGVTILFIGCFASIGYCGYRRPLFSSLFYLFL
jgi:hypothetical protein